MCDECFHRVLLLPAAVDTITADVFAALEALEYVIIIINTIVIIGRGDIEPPNPARDHPPAISTIYYKGDNVATRQRRQRCLRDNVCAYSQEMASFLSGHRRIV